MVKNRNCCSNNSYFGEITDLDEKEKKVIMDAIGLANEVSFIVEEEDVALDRFEEFRENGKVGDTFPLILSDGKTFTLRIVDAIPNRFECVDSSETQTKVVEFAELLDDIYQMNTASPATNEGGWQRSYMRNTVMQNIWSLLPREFRDIVLEVKLTGLNGGISVDTSQTNDRIWLPAACELFDTNDTYSKEDPKGMFEYYQTLTGREKSKKLLTSGQVSWQWLRTPDIDNSTQFILIPNNGSMSETNAFVRAGVAPFFAI